ncbi:fatty acid resistance MFS efflux transporter adaptor subunit FarA [Corallincola platygyrae]
MERLLVERGEQVVEGDLLFTINRRNAFLEYERSLFRLSALVDSEISRCIDLSELTLQSEIQQKELKYSQGVLSKYRSLGELGLIDANFVDKQALEAEVSDLEAAIEKQRLLSNHFKQREPITSRPAIKQAISDVRESFYNLKSTEIRAPANGYVYELIAYQGMYADEGVNLLVMVPTEDMLFEANVLESKLSQIKVGDTAEVTPDAYGGDVKLNGVVHSIVPSITASFSTIPRNNLDSNWVKTMQRVPVLIAIEEPPSKRLPLGSSAKVSIHTNVEATTLVSDGAQAGGPEDIGASIDSHLVSVGDVWDVEFEKVITSELKAKHQHLKALPELTCAWE